MNFPFKCDKCNRLHGFTETGGSWVLQMDIEGLWLKHGVTCE